METTTTSSRLRRLLQRGLGAALAVLAAAAAPAASPAQGQEQGEQQGSSQLQRAEPLARVGLTPEFSTTLDSAPQAADWELLRNTVALRYEPGKNEKLDPGRRKHLVLHAAVIRNGEIQEQHTSDPVDLLPGATKLDPDAYLPESTLVPDGYRIGNLMALGEIQVQPGQIMTDLVRDIVGDLTRQAPALYLAATPPEEEMDGPHKIHPVLIQLAPVQGTGGAGGGAGG